ncbi:MAG TPA: hypothetical protein PKB10_07940, partial [Tepidisphaeraceae bacterium]|nr:hypothetical protein [Tepidisphaeraceae bacterium]
MTGRTIVTLMMFCGSLLTGAASAQRFSTEQYVWRIPHDDAGGNCTQFVIHPTDPKLRLVASGDIGLYRWQFDEGRWICISDWNADIHGGYIAGVAVDPTDSSRIFYAAGRGKGDVYVSHDQGRTFTPSKAAWPDGRQLYVNGGEHASTNGPLLAVDPQNPQVLYYASRLDGLWRSVAGSAPASWHRVDRFPARGDVVETFDADGKKLRNLSPTGGLNFIAIDGTSPVIEVDGVSRSSILYVGIGGDLRTQSERGGEVAIERQGGLWRSTDGGQSFQRLADPDDTREHSSGRGYVDSLGNLYAIRSNRLVRVARASDQITDLNVPGERAIRSVAIDPRDPQHLVAARQAVARRELSYEETNRLFRSLDAGKTWVELKNVTFNSPGWWNWFLTPTWWVQFDPHGPTDEAGRSRQFWAGDLLG